MRVVNTTTDKPRLIDRLLLGKLAWERGARIAGGEQSELRRPDGAFGSFGSIGSFSSLIEYQLDSSHVDYPLARELYANRNDKYKLGAWAAKPVVNTLAGFMGAPSFIAANADDYMQGIIDEGPGTWLGHFHKINRNTARDGDVYVMLLPKTRRFVAPQEKDDVEIGVTLLPPERVDPTFDTLTGEFSKVVITWPVLEKTTSDDGRRVEKRQYTVTEILTKEKRLLIASPHAPQGAQDALNALMEEDGSNPWGCIPIVQFRNEAEEHALYGTSEIEAIEPFMKAYHDVLKAAIQGGRQLARPKTKFVLKDVGKFLARNFGKDWQRRERLNFANKDVYLLFDGENAEHISATFDVAGISTLLEFLFMCIVDVSETPEFAFGTAVSSSKASTETQMPVLGRRIERKRGNQTESMAEFCALYLFLRARVGTPGIVSYKTTVDWTDFTPKDDKQIAETLAEIVNALVDAVREGILSHEAAVSYLQEFIPTMADYVVEGRNVEGERDRIVTGLTLLERMKAGTLPDDLDIDPETGRPQLRPVSGGGAD